MPTTLFVFIDIFVVLFDLVFCVFLVVFLLFVFLLFFLLVLFLHLGIGLGKRIHCGGVAVFSDQFKVVAGTLGPSDAHVLGIEHDIVTNQSVCSEDTSIGFGGIQTIRDGSIRHGFHVVGCRNCYNHVVGIILVQISRQPWHVVGIPTSVLFGNFLVHVDVSRELQQQCWKLVNFFRTQLEFVVRPSHSRQSFPVVGELFFDDRAKVRVGGSAVDNHTSLVVDHGCSGKLDGGSIFESGLGQISRASVPQIHFTHVNIVVSRLLLLVA
mmetsp:Transcript_10245/g.25730  ORF Transcript_10245/g.25730 Transcript_10245/m.25730 type:complete len:268 (+) Transcript_10245:428-1231(+)